MGIFCKFTILLWKCYLIQIRHPLRTFFELFIPIVLFLFLSVVRMAFQPVETGPRLFPNFDPVFPSKMSYLVYSPDNPILERIVVSVADELEIPTIFSFRSSKIMLLAITDTVKNDNILAAIQFDDDLYGNVDIPKKIQIALRFPPVLRFTSTSDDYDDDEDKSTIIRETNTWVTNLIFPSHQQTGPREPNSSFTASPKYFEEGFLALQFLLTKNLLEYFGGEMPRVSMQRFPHPAWFIDTIWGLWTIPVWIVLSFLYTFVNTVRVLTLEKEMQLNEALRILGVSNALQRTAWFVKSLSFWSISLVVIVGFMKWGGIYRNNLCFLKWSDVTIISVFLFVYLCTSVSLSFMMAAFFSKAKTAAVVSGVVWVCSILPYFIIKNARKIDDLANVIFCVFSNSALGFGVDVILEFERSGKGLQWKNIWAPASAEMDLSLGFVAVLLTFDAFLYLLIALYVEAFQPARYRTPRAWYFPWVSKYWWRKKSKPPDDDNDMQPGEESESFELPVAIELKHLRKTIGSKVIVQDLTLNAHEGQTTVLFGATGSGKSATLLMLTGVYVPSGGSAVIGGHDLYKQLSKIRARLGFCPEHNILFKELTVHEHLYLYSRLRGLTHKRANEEAKKYMEQLELQEKKKKRSSKLSHGSRRKLSLALAMCGDPKVILLDELTANVDTFTKRTMWEFLSEHKQGKTILLTTRSMEEAELLADKMAILANGRLQSSGSIPFLKKQFGSRYQLVIEKGEDCTPRIVTPFLRGFVPNAQHESNFSSQLIYCLPAEDSKLFLQMLLDLESKQLALGIQTFGIALRSLETIFLQMGKSERRSDDKETDAQTTSDASPSNPSIRAQIKQVPNIDTKPATRLKSLRYQFMAMCLKKRRCTCRARLVLLFQILIPLLCLLTELFNLRQTRREGDLPELDFTLESYNEPIVTVSGENKYKSKYLSLIEKSGYTCIDWGGKNFTEKLLREATENGKKVRDQYIVGTTFQNDGSMVLWFNNQPYHSPGLALAMALQTIVQQQLGNAYDIEITNYPLPFSLTQKMKYIENMNNQNTDLYLLVAFLMVLVTSLFVLFYVRERVSKFKHLQFTSGVNVFVFWFTSLAVDYALFAVISGLVVGLIACFQLNGLKTVGELGRLSLILVCFGYAVLPFEVFGSLFFDPTACFIVMFIVGVAMEIIGLQMYMYLISKHKIAEILNWFLMIFPHYDLILSLFYMERRRIEYEKSCKNGAELCLYTRSKTLSECWELMCDRKSLCCDEQYFKWELPGVGRFLIYEAAIGTILIVLIIVLDFHVTKYASQPWITLTSSTHEDDDVLDEKQRVHLMPKEDIPKYALILKNVTKYYWMTLAVKNISVCVLPNECFAVLGKNGAGKSTLFKMMTGDMAMTSGKMYVNGVNYKWNMHKIHRNVGYCPQLYALMDELTGRETMTIFCLLRGTRRRDCDEVAETFAEKLGFTKHLDDRVKMYSEADKRKVNVAIALTGNPKLLFLDDPTIGLDAGAKRCLWDLLRQYRDAGTCIILTSQSIEECEALCTRLAIMVNGEFKCLGSIRDLEAKFAKGYTLTVKVRKPRNSDERSFVDTTQVQRFVMEKLKGAKLKEARGAMLTYEIPSGENSLGNVFDTVDTARESLGVEEFSVEQSSLKQVFLRFTRQQSTGKDEEVTQKKHRLRRRKQSV